MAFSISDPRMVIRAGDTFIARETLERGEHGLFEAVLIRRSGGAYDVEVFMKVQFVFINGKPGQYSGSPGLKWTSSERQAFMKKWHKTIRASWNQTNVSRFGLTPIRQDGDQCLPSGKPGPVNVTFNFLLHEGGPMMSHFKVEVFKVSPSKAIPDYGSVHRRKTLTDLQDLSSDSEIDSNSLKPISEALANKIKANGVPSAAGYVVASHEFGHMIGLEDEYKDSIHIKDVRSAMHSGSEIRPRHYQYLVGWASTRIDTFQDPFPSLFKGF